MIDYKSAGLTEDLKMMYKWMDLGRKGRREIMAS